ncbi:DUF6630 family protein [Enterococcus sp. LJL51]|uniref:DUF6630 family protein n=1 Tax=Enterococcus sp. LJL51 TaxID=3416656 RepID=UPI003CF71831
MRFFKRIFGRKSEPIEIDLKPISNIKTTEISKEKELRIFQDLSKHELSKVAESIQAIADKQAKNQKQAYIDLAGWFTQRNQQAVSGMTLALNDTQAFFEHYQLFLSQGFIEQLTVSELVEEYDGTSLWDKLNWVLKACGYLTEIDWKEDAEDFVYFVDEILKKYNLSLDHTKIIDTEAMAPEFFQQLKEAMPDQLVLVCLDSESDSYQLAVLPVEYAEQVRKAVEVLNRRLHWFWKVGQIEEAKISIGSYKKVCQKIWRLYIPAQGQSTHLYGELLRQVEKLRWEAQNNGNINWDSNFSYFCDFIGEELTQDPAVPLKDKQRILEAVTTLKEIGERTEQYHEGHISDEEMFAEDSALFAYVKDDLYDMLGNYIGYLYETNLEIPAFTPKEGIYR